MTKNNVAGLCMAFGIAVGLPALIVWSSYHDKLVATERIEQEGIKVTKLDRSVFANPDCNDKGEMKKGYYHFTAKDSGGNEVTGTYCRKHLFANDTSPSVKFTPAPPKMK